MLPHDWPKRRIRTLRRDGYRCQHRDRQGAPICGASSARVARVKSGGDFDYSNLRTLCPAHDSTPEGGS